MKYEHFTFYDPQDFEIYVYKWMPEEGTVPKAAIQIAHGMAETAARYERLADYLTSHGYIVYANDHRGHGRTAKSLDNVGYLGKDGFNWAVKDMHQLNGIIRKENTELPVILIGHSMGSFMSQQYITLYGESLDALILSGTNGAFGFDVSAGILLARLEIALKGDKHRSKLLDKMSFGKFNNPFKPARTQFDWLSRDCQEVDKYIDNPYCGSVFSAGYFYDLARALKKLHLPDAMSKIPKELPIYIFSGDMDPVGNYGKGPKRLYNMYKELNIKNVTLKLYKNGRHEMLNETNRDEVMKDILDWLNNNVSYNK
ncbi:MAG: alpha/beta hydrolase [Bacillota bacterium]